MRDSIAYCGLDCERCDAYIATVNDDEELRRQVAERWSKINNVEITPDMIVCDGCRRDGRKTVYCQSMCPVRKCAIGKGYGTCAECPDMNSCPDMSSIIEFSPEVLENLGKERIS